MKIKVNITVSHQEEKEIDIERHGLVPAWVADNRQCGLCGFSIGNLDKPIAAFKPKGQIVQYAHEHCFLSKTFNNPQP